MKQDRNGVRTAQDLERKYDLSSIGTLKRNYELQKTSLNKVENELNNFVSVTTQNIEELQNQVDGNITTWFSSGIPTLNNYPASEWKDDDIRNNHLGDLYYDRETGYAYRFTLEENTYQWIDIKDTDVTQALALANAAQDTADSKRRVFVVQPTPPYDVGDLWLKDEELYRCQITKGEKESYAERDWIKATKYTDDTVAYQVDGKLTILSGTVTEIRDDVDELSTTMTNTTKLVDEHGNTIGTLQEQQSSTIQTVNEISSTVSSVSNRVDSQGNTISNLSTKVNGLESDIQGVSADFNDFKDNEYIQSINNLQNQIDGAIQFWNGSNIPTLNNYPASDWTTEQDRINHQADIYTVIQDVSGEMKQGKSYRFDKVNGTWQWIELTDNELSAVQAIAQEALGKANTNASDITTLKSNVSELKQTDTEISARVTSNTNNIGEIQSSIVPTDTSSGSSIYLEDSAEAELIDFELEGKTEQEHEPTPDNPSELVSVGYENLFDKDGNQILEAFINGSTGVITNYNATRMLYIECKSNTTYTFSRIGGTRLIIGTTNVIPTNGIIVNDIVTDNSATVKTYTTNTNAKYLCVFYYNSGSDTLTEENIRNSIQITKGTQPHNYIPYGKYGIEVKTNGRNLIGYNNSLPYTNSGITLSKNDDIYTISGTASAYFYKKIFTISAGTLNGEYLLKKINISGTPLAEIRIVDRTVSPVRIIKGTGSNTTFTITSEHNDLDVEITTNNSSTYNETFEILLQLSNIDVTTYEPYKSNTYLYTLDNPLRSIGDTKDLLYIKNGMLYVDRKIGSVVLNGSENWALNSSSGNSYRYFLNGVNFTNVINNMMIGQDSTSDFIDKIKTNFFTYSKWAETQIGTFSVNNGTTVQWFLLNTNITTLANFKTWLSTHNTEVQYILAEPYTEELGEVQIPSTYKGITYINTTDELEPNMNITYVRDTLIANYVESHISELKINEQGIEARVETIEESDYGSKINQLESSITSQEARLDILSTNIDTTTGEVREVTTSNGLKFNSQGLNLYTGQDSYNTLINNVGTYYKDGDNVISETTKDGFMATNSKNKGQHSYSYDETNDLYEFIDERVEADGEYCYATFYNGEE